MDVDVWSFDEIAGLLVKRSWKNVFENDYRWLKNNIYQSSNY